MRLLLAALLILAGATSAIAEGLPSRNPTFDALAAETRAKMLTSPTLAVRDAERARAYAAARPNGRDREIMLATADWLKGEAYTRFGRNDRAGPLLESAVRQATQVAPGSQLLASALLSRGSLRAAEGRIGPAITDLHAAHDLFQTMGESRGRARAFTQIAILYYDANDWTNALRYFSQALDVYHADPGLALSIHNGQGLAQLELRQWDAASRSFAQALTLARDLKSPLLTATVLRNVARARLMNHQARAAEAPARESIALARGVAPPDFIRRQIALLAQVSYQTHDLRRAEQLVDQAFRGVDLTKTSLADREAHETASAIYRALGRSDLALTHLTALKRLDDEATDLARSNGAALMAARFDFANQELRIAKLKTDDLRKSIAFERARARTQRIILTNGVVATLLVIAVLAFALVAVRRSRDRVRAANVDLGSTNLALEKALAAKTDFLATTSHEIRTPLNGILGMTQVMLADPRMDPSIRDRMSIVHDAGITMRALVDDILDVAKMESGHLTIARETFDLCRTLSDSTRIWEGQAHAKGLAFNVDVADCPAAIVGDPDRLRQIVFNLLSNALKFTPSGSIALLATRRGEQYQVAVTDTGIGVAPERHEEIFESFRQADTTTTRRFGGTGLGLTICRNLARAMGGDVTVDSTEGDGATFTLTLPLIESTVERGIDGVELCPATLIVEPNPITRAKLKSVLEAAGPIMAVSDIAEATRLLASRRCQAIVADEHALGAANEATATLQILSRAAADARIVILRQPGGTDRDTLLFGGAAIVLDRPVARDTLLLALRDKPDGPHAVMVVPQAA